MCSKKNVVYYMKVCWLADSLRMIIAVCVIVAIVMCPDGDLFLLTIR